MSSNPRDKGQYEMNDRQTVLKQFYVLLRFSADNASLDSLIDL